jgi:hypothetical protein
MNSQGNTKQKEQFWRYHSTWLQTILQTNSNKNSMVLAQRQTWRLVEQNREPRYESTQLYPPHFWQRWQKYIMEKDSFFNKCCWENWLSICKKLKLDPCLSPYTSINSKWIKDISIWPETLKLLQEGTGNTLEQIGIGKDFLNRTPAAQQLRERMDKWDFIKLISLCTTKEMVSKLKRTPTE